MKDFACSTALARKLFGSSNERRIKSYRPRVDAINALEPDSKSSPTKRCARAPANSAAARRRQDPRRYAGEAFATCREAAKRTLGQRHFDVQLIGGMILHEGRSPR